MFLKSKKKSKLRVFFRFLFFIIAILLICGLFYVVIYSDLLKVQSFDFKYSNNYYKEGEGNRDEVSVSRTDAGTSSIFFTNDFLISSLTSQIIKEKKVLGYLGSDNILFWFFGEKEKLVNNNILPSVKEIDIEVDVIKREVDILVKEKELTGVICKPENSCFAFDDSGRIFALAPTVKGSLIFKIDDPNKRPLVLGEKFLSRDKWIDNIMETVEVIKENGFNIESAAIREMDLAEWEIILSAGPKLLFSLDFVPGDLKEVMKTLKERADFSTINYFDMRVENRIYYK